MPQTAANFRSEDDAIDHTPAAAVLGGDVVVVGQIPLVALTDIAANTLGSLATEGIFAVPKITGAIALGDQIFWNPTGSPVSGDAASGACNNTGVGRFMGYAVAAAISAAVRVDVILAGPKTRGLPPVLAVAAAGSTNANGTAVPASAPIAIVNATAGDGTTGIVLPVPPAGQIFIVKNNAGLVLKVYPGTGVAINALTATTGSISMAANTTAIFFATSATQWFTLPLLPS